MEYVYLGCVKTPVSRFCLGCVSFGGHDYGRVEEKTCIDIVHKAIEKGVNFFDTADIYGLGRSEEILGKALSSHKKSENIVVATKFGVVWNGRTTAKDINPARIEKALDDSLRRLRRDRIELYMIHWYDNASKLEDVMIVLEKLKSKGKIACIGCSNFDQSLLAELSAYGRIDAIQLPYNLIEKQNEDMLKQAYNKNMLTMSYNVLLQGLLTGKYNENSHFSGTDLRQRSKFFNSQEISGNLNIADQLKERAKKLKCSQTELAIRYVLEKPFISCVTVGAKNTTQLEENVRACELF